MKERNTKQKELILKELENDYTHPTILELYEKLRKKNPKIGKATVYRNISKLVEEGKVRKVLTTDGIDHYDGDCSNHSHFMCNICHKLYDLYDVDTDILISKAKKNHSFSISNASVLFEGICDKCK